jgi:hypothetical protein
MPQLRGGLSGWYTSTDATGENFLPVALVALRAIQFLAAFNLF